ncbi:hypothetical protein HRR83_003982 [Exophiala dermatitidis]|uniref:Uncharacterized protein n=2 Tax=Exophiala dermatitidis TaxID=5970 RepID=H6BQ98_EXODN|nr:uncharacterized protein HMPREF1120_01952 [Exophiala dermatitidis NIH/UT8656]KAJ4518740.1 hypothetical protein HRR75_002412 [Exophiala dermatitidis]EHY53768.1 hypothetical protein HMPREF1120_01952 [Exophiala dermatitidis NIH/UT8656]KAJ4522053.1 hypothetical protein HRR74_002632 [Exophiala dermatitidis]KAJ4529379.1 hypothetical protein HRR73_000402 [Exophiala dermatitidis]KAJ4543965.1 hypothetical protein HRR76_002025 [Exophiala dermatitidis]
MKDTLRKKPAKASADGEVQNPSQLESSESASSNPWAGETTSTAVNNNEAISRQTSKASQNSGNVSRRTSQSTVPPPVTEAKSPSLGPSNGQSQRQSLDVPGEATLAAKPTRRRKTITKTPHTFELEADLNPPKVPEQPPISTTTATATATATTAEPPLLKQESPVVKKKKKRLSQPPPPEGGLVEPASSSSNNTVPTPPPQRSASASTSPSAPPPQGDTNSSTIESSSPSTPVQTTPSRAHPATLSPSTSTSAPTNPFTTATTATQRPKKSKPKSSSESPSSPTKPTAAVAIVPPSNPCRFTPPPLSASNFQGKVIVLTNGTSLTSQSLIRAFHSAGSRVIFGDSQHQAEQARRLISSLGPPHVVHFNKCDMTKYSDILELFQLATTMYGRVDHAVFGVGDDGGQACSVAQGEKGWFDQEGGSRSGNSGGSNSSKGGGIYNKSARAAALAEVETEPPSGTDIGDIITASVRFARIALAYLRYSPRPRRKTEQKDTESNDRSLTFVTSVAAFKDLPSLPIYQVAQHAILGLVRSLRATVDPDPERGDGVRVNAVVTNVMVPRAIEQSDGGRMSVQLPIDRPDDVARVIGGVVAAGATTSDTVNTVISATGSTSHEDEDGDNTRAGVGGEGKEGEEDRSPIWYEKGYERGVRDRHLHGRVIYSVGLDCWDIQEGLDMSEPVWMGTRPSEALASSLDGLPSVTRPGTGADGQGANWILDLA